MYLHRAIQLPNGGRDERVLGLDCPWRNRSAFRGLIFVEQFRSRHRKLENSVCMRINQRGRVIPVTRRVGFAAAAISEEGG